MLYFVVKCKAMPEAKLSSKNQIVIPREARRALGLAAGDKVLVVVRGKRVLVLQKPRSHRTTIRGLAGSLYPSRHLQKERQSWR
jgi:AbrB family looped-hinge helix DNA binding protein